MLFKKAVKQSQPGWQAVNDHDSAGVVRQVNAVVACDEDKPLIGGRGKLLDTFVSVVAAEQICGSPPVLRSVPSWHHDCRLESISRIVRPLACVFLIRALWGEQHQSLTVTRPTAGRDNDLWNTAEGADEFVVNFERCRQVDAAHTISKTRNLLNGGQKRSELDSLVIE